MPPKRALYSVVQYVPDDGRAEAANVGVLLYVPSDRWINVKVSESLERVRQFFRPGKQELRRVGLALDAFSDRMQLARGEFADESDLIQFCASRADAVRPSTPRLVMVEDPFLELDELFDELVGDRDLAIADAKRSPSLPTKLAEVFGKLQAEHRAWRPGTIQLPTTGRSFDIPVAFQNGRVNYVRPESLAPGGRLDSRMERLGFNGQLIWKHPIDDREGKLVVLSSDPLADERVERRFAEVLDEFNVRFVPHAQADAFADEVERVAH